MNANLKHWLAESMLAIIYFLVLVFVFLPVYLNIYSYLLNNSYVFSVSKFLVAILVILISNIALKGRDEDQNTAYCLALRFFYVLSFIPMVALYACGEKQDLSSIIEPLIFGMIFLFCMRSYSLHAAEKTQVSIKYYPLLNADLYVLVFCGGISVLTWALAGFPIVLSFSEGYEQRMALRANALPSIINYLYTMVGGALLPYLFARNLIKKQYLRMLFSLAFGLLLYFVNGMKTWLFLYLFAVAILYLERKTKTDFGMCVGVEVGMIAIVTAAAFISSRTGILAVISQVGRVIIIPNNIGFKYVDFFRSNERLYLRESILRAFLSSPYPNGSDFFINYGTDTTLTSSRANNGLFGDAYRNFGLAGVIIYPFLISKVMNIIERNCIYEDPALRYFILFILVWGAINTSFFTWLLTGGILILYVLLKIYQANAKKEQISFDQFEIIINEE